MVYNIVAVHTVYVEWWCTL